MISKANAGISKSKALICSSSSATSPPSFSKPPLPIVPRTCKNALQNEAWFNTMTVEDAALKRKQTWKLIPPALDQTLIRNKWVFKVKTKVDGTLDKLKARLVARGFEQIDVLDDPPKMASLSSC